MRAHSKKSEWRYVDIKRRGGIVQVTLHTGGGPFRFGAEQHRELGEMFGQIGRDERTKVLIVTGSGDAFCSEFDWSSIPAEHTAETWDRVYQEGKHLIMNLLDIEVPVIAAVRSGAGSCGNCAAFGHRAVR